MKADGLERPEGKSHEYTMASNYDTTGVLGLVMYAQRWLGNLREPMSLLAGATGG